MRLATKLPWIAGLLFAAGIIAAISVYRQQSSPPPQPSAAEEDRIEESLNQVLSDASPGRSTAAPAAAKTPGSTLPAADSARAAVATAAEIDWEHLVARTPETALSQLQRAVPKDEAEAQRFSVYEVRALANLQRMGEAHAKAEAYFERWPAGPDLAFLGSLTGAHPKR